MRLNQIVAGVMMNLLALGTTSFANQAIFGPGGASPVPGFHPLSIPGLSTIPLLGKALFRQNLFTYLAIAAVVTIAVFLGHSRAGLALKAVGEHPLAAETRGISVLRVRYAAVLFSGAMCGLAGAALSIGTVDVFVENMTQGRGFLAVAAVIAAAWRPLWVVAACLMFGIADAAQVWAQVFAIHIPHQILGMAPYLVTLLALVLLQRRPAMPAALGRPFAREAV
jgi:simple sugar transport system permease protein